MTGDVINIEWRGNSAQLQKDLDTTNARAKELKKTIVEIERDGGKGSEKWQKYKNELKTTQEQAAKLAKELKTMDVSAMSMRQLELHAKDLAKELKNADRSSQDYVKNAKRLGEVERELEKAKKQAAALKAEGDDLGKPGLWSKITSGVKGVGTAFQAIMALQVIQWIVDIGKQIFNTTASFEKYEKVLTTALGGQKEAKQSLEAIKKMAKETSFGVDELTEGYVKMVNRGLRPSQKEMTNLADLAASQGKTFDDITEAILDAMTGENERLKAFGINASKSGDQVTYTFKGVQKTVANTPEAINAAIISLGALEGVAGQNAIMMETLGGKASNFGDVMDLLMVTIGDRLSPIFMFFLDLIADSVEYFVEVINATDPVLQVFQDLFNVIGDMAGAFINIFSNVFPKFNTGGHLLTTVMQAVAMVFRAALAPTQLFIGVLADVFQAIGGIVQGGKALIQVFAGDFSGAAESFEKSKTNFSSVGSHAAASFDKIKKGWTEAFVTQPKKDIPEAVFAAKTAEQGRQDAVTDTQKKEQEKRAKEREKGENKLNEMIKQLDAEHNQVTANNAIQTEEFKIQEKRRKRLKEIADSAADEKTKEAARILVNRNADAEIFAAREKDNKKALELLSALEAEHVQKSTRDALTAEESKIQQLKTKRLADIQDSAADATTKAQVIQAINDAAEASLSKVREDYRLKRAKEEEAAAAKRLETENFILDKQRTAEMAMFDWREMQARGNSAKIAVIKKDRVDADLRLTHQRLEAEMAAEQQKAIALTHDAEQLAIALDAIDAKFHSQGLAATKKAADDKLAIDKDLHEKKAANMKKYSDMFSSLLNGDVSGFMTGLGSMVKGHQESWQKRLSADMQSFEQGAQMAQQAVSFLNDLAQKKAEKAIAEANRERDEKVAILTNELNVTDSLIKSSSDYVTALKEAETNRLAELQRILTSETSTEEEKRDALKKYYSENLQQMKAAEEAKIQDLQRLANMAKTDDEKRAIEAKIELAKQESAEKIRLAEEETEAKKTNLDELNQFNKEMSDDALKEANTFSEKQIKLSTEEADQKADLKIELEETIAAENRKARATEQAEKIKAFKAQKKADIATALITGALAILKALANFFPLNIVLAATAAVTTGVQIAKIKSQPDPVFAKGGTLGHVPQGSRHASIYGHGGIGLFDNRTGANVGEMEGGEAIVSVDQTEANWPLLQQMFKNARTPGKQKTPIIPHPATPMAFKYGGKFESPYYERGMYLFGSKKKKAEAAAREAEEEAAKAQAEADAAMGDMPSFDGGAYGGIDSSDPSASGDQSAAMASHQEAQRMGKEQLEAIKGILDETLSNGETLTRILSLLGETKSAVNSVDNNVSSVRDAIYNTNTQSKFDTLIGAISSMSA